MKILLLSVVLAAVPFQLSFADSEAESFQMYPGSQISNSDGTPRPAPKALPGQTGRALLYENAFLYDGGKYLELLKNHPTDDITTLPSDKQQACETRYQTLLNDGKIDIRMAFGYFNWSTGNDIIYEGRNFGPSPAADLGGYRAMEKFLLKPCDSALQICGFSKDTQEPGLYTKAVAIRGQTYQVELRMSQPSLTEFHGENLLRINEQNEKSEQTKTFYMQALQDADFAIYLGHSREGGGPDFFLPVLKDDGHTNYQGYYVPRKMGVKMMVDALKKSGRQAPIMSLMSCDSRDHFYQTLRGVAPRMGIISSTEVNTVNNLFAANLGAIDSLLRGQCQKSFYQSMRLDPAFGSLITMDGMFE